MRAIWNPDCLLDGCEGSAKAMGEALSSSSSRHRQVRSSGDPLIELLTFIFGNRLEWTADAGEPPRYPS
jgi:hypothetical protein